VISNFFSGSALDRASILRRDEAALAALLRRSDTRLLPVRQSQNLLRDTAIAALSPSLAEDLLAVGEPPVFLGLQDGIAYFAVDVSDIALESVPDLTAHGSFADLRQIGGTLSQADGALLAFARAMIHWHRTHRHCGRCGAPTRSAQGGHVRRCGAEGCGAEIFPRTDPAVIMLVSAGDLCLLGRQPAWPSGMVSTLAGFVEPGETPEEAVIREVMEETGVQVTSVRYHSAQPWPFPGSLMIGYDRIYG
jgi:NAD+ diphosphatase